MATFGERLKEEREKARAKQEDMAAMLEVSLRAYQIYEYDEGYPRYLKLIALADYFDVSLDYLVGRSDIRERR